MLLKVFRHSFKKPFKTVLIISICSLVSAILLGGLIRLGLVLSPVNAEIFNGTYISLMLFLILAVLGTVVASAFVVITSIGKDIYSDQAYLTFTLPVTAKEHVLGRLLTAACYYLIISLVGLLSVAFIVLIGLVGNEFFELLWQELLFVFDSTDFVGFDGAWLVVYQIQSVIIGVVGSVSIYFVAFLMTIILKSLKSRSKLLAVIVFIVAIDVVSSFSMGFSFVDLFGEVSPAIYNLITFIGLLVSVAVCFILYKVLIFSIDKKLNLD